MLVERIMTSPAKTLTEEHTIEDALNLMSANAFRHIPIVDKDARLVGIISDRDIKLTLPSVLSDEDPDFTLNVPISRIMRKRVTYCHPMDFVEEIALDFYHYSIGAIPVLRDDRVIGIVTQKDMLNTYIELTGMTEPGSIIEIDIEDRTGVIYDIGKVFKELNIRIISISVYRNKGKKGYKTILLRVQAMNPRKAIDLLKDRGFTVLEPSQMGQ
ncbi:CBS domain-containing protein [Salinicoccus sp. ID82-1]|uniref:CBS and ACT domain-containing protein n=1 Tax=Salinicoccus sp. ID82-1 TaxID=2820269 RepID=UPI001F2F191F|nr:CBS and ACT domain-containing protein [Salinicoccus sp. ID82-1]MCG1009371.1 CBS domain-containing protein [Salinicoccus sp. ID82-1]